MYAAVIDMRIFSTRHGQVLPQRFFNDDMNFPVGDEPITDLGREQAKLLGIYLRDVIRFKGIIYTSPYDRTMETASIISEQLGIGFVPLPCLREMFVTYNASKDFVGLRPEQIKPKFPRAEVLPDMPYPWWEIKDDTVPDVCERLEKGLKPILEALPKETDVLLVGHAATVVALREVFHPKNYKSSLHWNCCVNLLYSSNGEEYAHDVSFFPPEKITANYVWYKDKLAEYEESVEKGKAFFAENKGKRIMHLGDLDSPLYPRYRRMIEEFKPDIIVHTGDLADEIKAGRVERVRDEWREKVPALIDAMTSSGARVLLTPGNNDIEEDLSSLAKGVEIYPRNTVVELDGKRVCLNHQVMLIDPSIEADIHFYGHGLTGEERMPDDNVRGNSRYFNAVWGVSLHDFESDRHLILPVVQL